MSAATVDKTLQRGLIIVYSSMLLSGLLAIAYTPPSMQETIGDTGAATWGWVMLVGASICLLGSLRPRGSEGDWLGEYVGLWATIAACGVYAVVIGSTTGLLSLDFVWAWPPVIPVAGAEPGRATGGLLLLGFTGLLVVRWFRVRDDARRSDVDDPPPTQPPR